MSQFRFTVISAGFEHGGNVIHRHLDGHPQLLVYPFESQLGNKDFTDFLSSIERVQYRYPEFPEGLNYDELYESIIDEELKTFLRKRTGSKFRDVTLEMSEEDRKDLFKTFLQKGPVTRSRVIEAFFRSTFQSWKNLNIPIREDSIHVGYSPVIGVDASRMIKDFPDIRIIHVIRNPFSAYSDTKKRPFPQPLLKYLISWNIFHSTAEIFANLYPANMKVLRYEDFVKDKSVFMKLLSEFVEIEYREELLYPSWNGQRLLGDIAPWGTVLRSTEDYNIEAIEKLSVEERALISKSTYPVAKHFKYDEIPYLRPHYC